MLSLESQAAKRWRAPPEAAQARSEVKTPVYWHPSAGFALPGSGFAGSAPLDAGVGELPLPFPDDELLVILHLSGDAGSICALHRAMHPSG